MNKRELMWKIIESAQPQPDSDGYCARTTYTTLTSSDMDKPFIKYYCGQVDREDSSPAVDEAYSWKYDPFNVTNFVPYRRLQVGDTISWECFSNDDPWILERVYNGRKNLFSFTSSDFNTYRKNLYSIDKHFLENEFVAMCDTSKKRTRTEGIIFMLTGFYADKSFIAYSEVKKITVGFNAFKGVATNMSFITSDRKLTVSAKSLDKVYPVTFAQLLSALIAVDREFPATKKAPLDTSRKVERVWIDQDSYDIGHRVGYIRASAEYAEKLRKQAAEFLADKTKLKQKQDNYEALLDEYEKTIVELQEQVHQNAGAEYTARLNAVRSDYNRLYNLQSA